MERSEVAPEMLRALCVDLHCNVRRLALLCASTCIAMCVDLHCYVRRPVFLVCGRGKKARRPIFFGASTWEEGTSTCIFLVCRREKKARRPVFFGVST